MIEADVVETLKNADYVRQRLSPQPGDLLFLHLSDLLSGLRRVNELVTGSVLDFGCGSSPYKSLFDASVYDRADYIKMPGIRFGVTFEGRIPDVPDASYNSVVSTQVLEHLASPDVYLNEAKRVLRPGGRLLLSTHGCFPDHGCPYDYRRWTADGLRHDLTACGLEVECIYKLTCGFRATLFWLGLAFQSPFPRKRNCLSILLRAFRRLHNSNRAFFTSMIDSRTRDLAVTPADLGSADVYVGLLAVVRKPY